LNDKLAILGGTPIRNSLFPKYPVIDEQEEKAVLEVLKSKNLSTFIASPGKNFLGGEKIRKFEKNFSEYIGTKYAISFNSATSALHAAIVSVGVEPGEEVIVPPYTFTSTATSALMHNAIPVFSDVSIDTFCLDPQKLHDVISPLTKAIIPVHLFGHPCDMDKILSFATKNNLKIIEDCAQAPGAKYKGTKVGNFGDCGIFSFQETKNMMTGEGGMLVTNDENIAKTAQMIRNHGEMVLETDIQRKYKSEILGWGYRMTEIEASLGIVQLSKLDSMNETRKTLANYLTEKLNSIEGLHHTKKEEVEHVYYVYALTYDEEKVGISREKFCEALRAEGIPFFGGYVKPLYLNPLYQERRAFAFKHYQGNVNYNKGICPNTENLHDKKLILTPVVRPPATIQDMEDIVKSIEKVLHFKKELIDE
jgi:perosamine synthetase